MRIAPEKKTWIPKVSDKHIQELAKRIKPIVRIPTYGLCYIRSVDPLAVYTGIPRFRLAARSLEVLCDITTYHPWSHHDYIRATIAEVLAQIPPQYLDGVVAFEVMGTPKSFRVLSKDCAARVALEAGFHTASTRLYTRNMTKRVAQ